jgi:hypothetical protein
VFLTILTLTHVAISLVGVLSGIIVAFGLVAGKRIDGWTGAFLTTTVLTSVTGFLFPVHHFMPSHAVGMLSLVLLSLAIYARYSQKLGGGWRKTYAVCAVASLYLNVFVAIVQAFGKIPPLKTLAPTQSEPPFKVTQAIVLALFVILGILATLRFRDKQVRPTQSTLLSQPKPNV